MLYVDTMKVLLGLLFLVTTCSSSSAKDPDSDPKKTKSALVESESLLSESTEESPHRYSDSNKHQQQPKGDIRYNDPQQRRTSNDDYGREKDDQVPQAYKFGYEVSDEHEGHQYRHEQKDEQGNVQGQFGYRDAKGQFRQVEYVADSYGFRAKVKTNEAGVDKQNPADVEIHKEEGQDFQKEYTKNVDTGPTEVANVLHHSEKSSASNYQHQQPAVESKPHVAPNHYYPQPTVESDGASHQYHRQPIEDKPHDAPDSYYRQPEVESEPHDPSKKYNRQPTESEPHDAAEHYHRQPVVESEPHGNNYEYDLKNVHPYTTYGDYGYPHTADQESNGYHQNQNVASGSPGPETNQYFMQERNPQSENDYSSEKYHSMPRTEMYKKAHKIVPPQPYVEKPSPEIPSTYQYELQMDGRTYKYVKKPSYSGREQPQAYQSSKEYYTNRPEHTEVKLEEMKMREPEYQGQTETNGEENYDSRERKLILPQSEVREYNIHSYMSAYPHNHEDLNQDHPNEESGGALKYDYNGYPLSSHSKEVEPEVKALPVAHQYVQIDEHEELSNPSVYNSDHVSYRHMHTPQEPSIVQPQQIMMMQPRKKSQMQEKVTAYEGNTYHHAIPQISSLQSLTYNGKSNEHQPLKKAVLELNPEIYKKLMENKSPGQRIVAIPVNGENAENSAPSAEPPHGVLHITLDGQSSFDPKAAPIILHIGNKQNENSRNAGHKYRGHIPLSNNHYAYSQLSAIPMYRPNTKLYRNKDNKNWIPMTQAWRSRIGRTSTNEDSRKVSSGEGFKFLQAESSNRKVNFQRQPPKIAKRVIPGIYIINTSKRVSKSKDSKSAQGHTLLSLIRK